MTVKNHKVMPGNINHGSPGVKSDQAPWNQSLPIMRYDYDNGSADSRRQMAEIWERMLLRDPNSQITPREIWSGPAPINRTPAGPLVEYTSPFEVGMYRPDQRPAREIHSIQIDPIPVSAETREQYVSGDPRSLDIAPVGVTTQYVGAERDTLRGGVDPFDVATVDNPVGETGMAAGIALIAAAAAAFMLA